MHVAHLSLTDFRSYPEAELALDPGVTALIGPNGQGKTNLVEAVGYVATLGSHRVAQDAPLVRAGAPRAIVRASVVRDARPTLVEIEITPGKANRARINRAPVPRAREVLGLLRTVLFAPEDLALVKGDPGERRRFLDDLLVARAPRYAGVRQDYERVVRQRSALLKSAGSAIRRGQGDVRTLDVWDQHLATAGAELLAGRLRLVAELADPVRRAYEQVSRGQGEATFTYRSGLGDELLAEVADAPGWGRELLQARLLEATSRMRATELERGVCLVGPHRDDLQLDARRPAGQGVRQPRRVVVVRARAATGVVRAAAPRGWWRPGPRSSTTSSPSSTSAAATAWPSSSPTPSRCSSPPPCRTTSPRRCRGLGSTSWRARSAVSDDGDLPPCRREPPAPSRST